MKMIKRISTILLLAAVLALAVVPVAVFAEDASTTVTHTEHIDVTSDGLCDIEGCDEEIPCNHTDVDGDGLCDIEGCDDKLPCTVHKDENRDGACDSDGCNEKVVCENHIDANEDGYCDTADCDAEVQLKNTIGTDKWEQNLYQALKILGIGILGIFLVTGIIILVVYALNKFTNIEKKFSESEE